MKPEQTRKNYSADFRHFMDFVKMDLNALVVRASQDRKWVEEQLMTFLWHVRERVKRKESTSNGYYQFRKSLSCTIDMNDFLVNRVKIERTTLRSVRNEDDRQPCGGPALGRRTTRWAYQEFPAHRRWH